MTTKANGDAVAPEYHAKVLRGEEPKATKEAIIAAQAYGKRALAKWITKVDGMGTNARAVAWAFAQESAWIHPGEDLEDCPVDKAPLTAKEFATIMAEIGVRLTDHHAVDAAYDAYMAIKPGRPEPPDEVKKAIAEGTQAPRVPKDPESWRDVIIPVPRKGMKKPEYAKHPDTIGALFDLRHGSDDECAAARSRLFGLVHNWKADGWTNAQGKHYPPSDADTKCRFALDSFWTWFEANHPGEKL